MSLKMEMKHKTILIIGASSGIGKELANQLATPGNRLILVARREQLQRELSRKLADRGTDFLIYPCDVADQVAVEQVCSDLAQKNIVPEILIYNAGVGNRFEVNQIDVGKFKYLYEVNVFGLLYFLKYLLPPMVQRGSGLIAGVSSMASTRGMPKSAPYSSSKAALNNLLESLRIDLWESGVKVCLIMPGFVRTPMTENNEFSMPFMIPAEKAAKHIINGLEKGYTEISFPFPMWLLTKVGKVFPNNFYAKIMQGRK